MVRIPRLVAATAALVTASGLMVGCSASASSRDTLVWYINPDSGGQAKVAANCSTDDYTITTQVLPQDANEQRIQLARRLAAEDSGIDIMSIDPPFTAEFANAGFLAALPDNLQSKLKEQSFDGATTAATWDGQLVVAPFWSNTQVLWYRKSFAQKAGIDMSKPVTWDQIIDAAAQNGGKVAVQANKYEG
jgi:multiple sugar transport system substrate-binding protein